MTSNLPEGVSSSAPVGNTQSVNSRIQPAVGRMPESPNKLFRDSHFQSDVDAEQHSIHHTLGYGPFQALPGSVYKKLLDQMSALAVVGKAELWLGGAIPNSYMLLKGSTISRTTYAELFALWGTKYGAGDGATTFGTPDTRNRELIGAIDLADIGASDASALGGRVHTHSHTHEINNFTGYEDMDTALFMGGTSSVSVAHTHAATSDNAGSHNHGGTNSATLPANTTTGGGAVSRLGPDATHSHSINNDGVHNHTIAVGAATSTAHAHTIDHQHYVPDHRHTIGPFNTNFGTMFNVAHPYFRIGVIVRYTTDLSAPGIS